MTDILVTVAIWC